MGVADFVSGDGVVRTATLGRGWVDPSVVSVCCHQGVFQGQGCDVALNNLVESCQLLPPALLQWWQVQLQLLLPALLQW